MADLPIELSEEPQSVFRGHPLYRFNVNFLYFSYHLSTDCYVFRFISFLKLTETCVAQLQIYRTYIFCWSQDR